MIEILYLSLILLVVLLPLGLFMKNMLPISLKQAVFHPDHSTFDSSMFLSLRLASLEWDHEDGFDDRRGMLLTALRCSASYDLIKDWTSAEQTAVSNYLIYLFTYAQEYVAQRNIRYAAAQYVAAAGDDAKAIWTDNSWDVFNQLNSRLPMPLMPQVIAWTELMNPLIRYAPEIAIRNIPTANYLCWIPTKTYAEMSALRATLMTHLEGMNWLRKAQIPFVSAPLTIALANQPHMVLYRNDPESAFWYESQSIMIDAGGVHTWRHPQAVDVAAGNIANYVYHYLPGMEPFPLYGVKDLCSVYNGANNLYGCLTDGSAHNNMPFVTYADDKVHIAKISFTGNAVALTLFTIITLVELTGILQVAKPDADDYANYESMFVGWLQQTTSPTVWDTATENTIATMFAPKVGPAIKPPRGGGGNHGKTQNKGKRNRGHRRPQSSRDNREAEA